MREGGFMASSVSLCRRCVLTAFLHLICALALWPIPSFADVVENTRSTQLIARWHERAFREQTAAEWLRGFGKIDRELPMLSPAEESWLKTEYDDEIARAGNRYTARALAASKSREYQIRTARLYLTPIISTLESLAQSEKTRDRPMPDREEIVLWTKLVSMFIEQDFWQAIDRLVQLRMINGSINGVTEFHYETYVLWARIVVNEVVLPYLTESASARHP
jgi:hypothetical protein